MPRNIFQKRLNRVHFLDFFGNQDEPRRNLTQRIILLEKRAERLSGIRLGGTVRHGILLFVQIAGEVVQHHDAAARLPLHECHNVHIRHAAGNHGLPLSEPLKRWSDLSVHEKHEIALTMIEVVTISDETGIDIKFSI